MGKEKVDKPSEKLLERGNVGSHLESQECDVLCFAWFLGCLKEGMRGAPWRKRGGWRARGQLL